MARPDSHDELSEAYLAHRFATRVRPYVFGAHQPSDRPVLVLVGGQPGAGKTHAMARLARRHGDTDLVPLTGDTLRQFHPRFRDLTRTDPLAVPNATAKATAAWVRASIDYALTNRFSLMLEGTFRDAAAVADTIRRFSSAGYRVVVVVLAVPVERSRLDCLLRSLGSNGTPGRWTPPSAHDTYYERLPATLATLQAVRELDQITITTRDGVDLYTNQRGTDRRWQHPGRAHDALTSHRDQSMLSGEAQTWLRQYRHLLDQLDTHRLDPRALPIYTRLHADASRVTAIATTDPSTTGLRYPGRQTGDIVQPADLVSSGSGRQTVAQAAGRLSRAFPVLSTTDHERDATPSTTPIVGSPRSRARRS